ncbi:MAG: hypothetical protein WA347_09360 [Rhabdochlamydiaceae bacterium]
MSRVRAPSIALLFIYPSGFKNREFGKVGALNFHQAAGRRRSRRY